MWKISRVIQHGLHLPQRPVVWVSQRRRLWSVPSGLVSLHFKSFISNRSIRKQLVFFRKLFLMLLLKLRLWREVDVDLSYDFYSKSHKRYSSIYLSGDFIVIKLGIVQGPEGPEVQSRFYKIKSKLKDKYCPPFPSHLLNSNIFSFRLRQPWWWLQRIALYF